MTVGHDIAVGEASQRQHTDAHEGDEPGTGAHDDGELPFLLVGDEPVVGPFRCEETEDMAEEYHDDTHMEEIAAPLEQEVVAQKLRGVSLHGLALGRDAIGHAADKEGTGDVGEILE